MSQGKLPGIAILTMALLPLSLFLSALFLAWSATTQDTDSNSSHFFRICSTAECTTFTWLHLIVFGIVCLSAAGLLVAIGVKKLRSTSA